LDQTNSSGDIVTKKQSYIQRESERGKGGDVHRKQNFIQKSIVMSSNKLWSQVEHIRKCTVVATKSNMFRVIAK